MKKITFCFVAMAALAMSAVSCSQSATSTSTDQADSGQAEEAAVLSVVPAADTTGDVIVLKNDDLFRPDSKVVRLSVLDFNAVWCVPCKKLTPAYHEAAKAFEGRVDFYSVDIDSLKATTQAFNITGVPTVILISPDGQVQTHVGLDDFTEGLNLQTATPEELTEAITANLTSMIEKAL